MSNKKYLNILFKIHTSNIYTTEDKLFSKYQPFIVNKSNLKVLTDYARWHRIIITNPTGLCH